MNFSKSSAPYLKSISGNLSQSFHSELKSKLMSFWFSNKPITFNVFLNLCISFFCAYIALLIKSKRINEIKKGTQMFRGRSELWSRPQTKILISILVFGIKQFRFFLTPSLFQTSFCLVLFFFRLIIYSKSQTKIS